MTALLLSACDNIDTSPEKLIGNMLRTMCRSSGGQCVENPSR